MENKFQFRTRRGKDSVLYTYTKTGNDSCVISWNNNDESMAGSNPDSYTVREVENYVKSGSWVIEEKVNKPEKKQPNTIRHIIDSKNNTVVILPDGRKGIAKLNPEEPETFSEYEGLRIALARAYGIEPFPEEDNFTVKLPKLPFNIGRSGTVNSYIVSKDVHNVNKFKLIANSNGETYENDVYTMEYLKKNLLSGVWVLEKTI